MPDRITDLHLRPHDIAFLDRLLAELKGSWEKETLAPRVESLIVEFRKLYLNHVIANSLPDLECHLGLRKSDGLKCVPLDAELDFAFGIEHFIRVFSLIRNGQGGDFDLPDRLYALRQSQIWFEGRTIEVELLAQEAWHYAFFRSVEGGEHYLEVTWHSGHASPSKLFKLEEREAKEFGTALKEGDSIKVEGVVQSYLDLAWRG